MKIYLSLVCSIIMYGAAHSQSYYKNGKYNRIGLQAKYAELTISSSDIEIT